MSLTWVQAASQGKWWMARFGGDKEASDRHVQQIADAHGVSLPQAHKAYRAVTDMLRRSPHDHPATSVGFTSQPKDHGWYEENPIPDDHDIHDHDGPERWAHLNPEQVDISRGVHATQPPMKPHMLAHNLFHPGKLIPTEEHLVGDPDHDPDIETHDARAEADGTEANSEQRRFYRPRNGKLYVADGHHRVAADLMLGKKQVSGLVWDDAKPPAKTCDDPGHEYCHEQKTFRQEVGVKWPPDPSSHKAQ